jgi:hypothetical protein
MVAISACGKVINPVPDLQNMQKSISLLQAESDCHLTPVKSSPIFNEVMSFYNEAIKNNNVILGGYFDTTNYDFQNPLLVNPIILKNMLEELRRHEKSKTLSFKELYRLLEFSNRYEGMKCQFENLMLKKNKDLRPYLNYIHGHNTSEENLIDICGKVEFLKTCKKELYAAKNLNQTINFKEKYLAKYEDQIVRPLFLLNNKHNNFNCVKSDQMVEMNIDIHNNGWNSEMFKSFMLAISDMWKSPKFKINLTEVSNIDNNTVLIKLLENGISHVSESEPRTIYLSNNSDLMGTSKVAAHEFGHILGFPDCYIEFYDIQNKELVYFELSNDNKNIMCSLKNGVMVQDSYIEQIMQNSCNFK